MTVHHILLFLSCLQYTIFMLFQRCNALTYFALPRSFPDLYFIPKSANIMFAFFLQETKKLGICGSYYLAFSPYTSTEKAGKTVK
jgi:hypothetical protein